MKRFVAIFFGTVVFVASLAYYRPLLDTLRNLYDRPFSGLTDAQLKAELATSREIIIMLGDQAARAGDAQSTREAWAEVAKADRRLRGIEAEQSFRTGKWRYLLVGAFIISFVAFFVFFRSAYRESRPGERSRERTRVQLAHESRESSRVRERAILADRLARIDERLLRLEVGRTDYRGVVDAVGRPVKTESDRGVTTLTYLFEVPSSFPDAPPERVAVLVLLREGVVAEVRVESAEAGRTIAQTG